VTPAALRRYALNHWLTGIVSGLVWMRTELGVLKWQAGHVPVAHYAGALTTAGAITQLSALVNGALASHLVRHWREGRQDTVQALLRGTTQATLLLAASGAHAVLLTSELLVPLLLGAEFRAAATIVDILAVTSVAMASGGGALLLQVVTDARFGLVSNGIAFVVLLALAVALVPLIGVAGAAVARGAAQVLVAELTYRRLATLPGCLDTARRLARAQRIATASLLACWCIAWLGGREPAVLVPATLLSLLLVLGLVRATIGVPLRRMLLAPAVPA
jgi:O-antigen/teichoic acid export membrane protein